MKNVTNEVAKRIYKAAKEQHVTISKLEQDLDLGVGFICSRRHSRTFPFEALVEIANYLGKPIWYFDDDCRKYVTEYMLNNMAKGA